MTTRADVAKAWKLWKRHRDIECVAMANAEPCDCADEDTWDRFEEVLDDFLALSPPREPTPSPADAPCHHPASATWSDGRTCCVKCGVDVPPPTGNALDLCPEHAIRLPCPACLPAAPRCEVCERIKAFNEKIGFEMEYCDEHGPACATREDGK